MTRESLNLLVLTLIALASLLDAVVVPIDDSNHDAILKNNEIVFVQFFADWCRFSQQLKPIFAEASEKFASVPAGKIMWASVDADKQTAIAARYHVNKYPTLKLFRNGELVKKEYRSQRSVAALSEYVQKQLDSAVQVYGDETQLKQQLDAKKRHVIGSFLEASGAEYDNFKKAAGVLREECVFHQGPALAGQPPKSIKFVAQNSQVQEPFPQDLSNFDQLKSWLQERCVPVVREITFENAEELTEEGLPFLILFKHPDDKDSEKIFTDAVLREIADQKKAVNCLVADGKRFAHPLHHLGKAEKDLPVIAIDSFRHMYLFEGMNSLSQAGKLRQFVMDLHSGKLHREFHHGPDAATVQVQVDPNGAPETQPPPSVFEKLKPSYNRYSIVNKDEL
ncbi:hypothetical protein PFISCL1PPCAC_17824 [Pristionchus fissidentatus]|uniref:Thioredoxin domain-containing protein n=1 Tax=Pristionchus fissidentatus TaxID=1538716 RepID=A0AAV5W3W2_9BILA|nr:hypothetical protein PFISCL1PPCAC_17824 [Pristionchus fissidentatus]